MSAFKCSPILPQKVICNEEVIIKHQSSHWNCLMTNDTFSALNILQSFWCRKIDEFHWDKQGFLFAMQIAMYLSKQGDLI